MNPFETHLRAPRFALAVIPTLVGLISLAAISAPGAVVAQTTSIEDGAVCMARGDLSVILPARDAAALTAKGFVIQQCEIAFPDAPSREKWRDEVCMMAATLNEKVQDGIERRVGERPAVLCGMAEEVVGAWQRGVEQ